MNIKTDIGPIDQIAFACRTLDDVETAKGMMAALYGVDPGGWSEDDVVAEGLVNGREGRNEARLCFCYELGIEFELLCYTGGESWLSERLKRAAIIPSHLGIHVESIDAALKSVPTDRVIVQAVSTLSHTNPAVPSHRRYQYCILDYQDRMPFDLKLIQRLTVGD